MDKLVEFNAEQQRDNLRALADLLKTIEPHQFTMETFFRWKSVFDEKWVEPLTVDDYRCGTVACALGHGPLVRPDMAKGRESWYHYSSRVFGIDSFNPMWEWLFTSNWIKADDTPAGAAKRIEMYLNGDVIPEDWYMKVFANKEKLY